MATWEFVDCRENASNKTARLPGSKLEGVLSVSVGHSTGVPNHPLCDMNVNGVVYRGILRDTLVPFARQHLGHHFRYQDDNATPHHTRIVTDYLQQGDITKIHQPTQSPDGNPSSIRGTNGGVQSTTWINPRIKSMKSARPCWISGPISLWNACGVWWPASPGD